jgi:hypothetical protein
VAVTLSASDLHHLSDIISKYFIIIASVPKLDPKRAQGKSVPVGRIARGKRAMCRSLGREPAPPRPPKPAGGAPTAECFEGSVGKEHFDAETRDRINIEERFKLIPTIAGHGHAATSVGSARAKPRRKSAAACALPHAVKKARVSAFRRPIQFSI